jgi:hypothetical protein
MRRIEPQSTGTAASRSTCVSDQPFDAWRCFANGATSPQLVKQIVNAMVASARFRVASVVRVAMTVLQIDFPE